MSKRKTTEEFIKDAKAIWGNKFDYSKVVYVNNQTKVIIRCKRHGDFEQLPNNHLRKHGCDICAQEVRIKKRAYSTEEFIKKAKKLWGDKFDYSKVKYKNSRTKIIIICKNHGEFKQTPSAHLSSHDCLKCSTERAAKKKTYSTEEFIKKVKTKPYSKNLDFSKTKYIKMSEDVKVSCKIKDHGDFKTRAEYLLKRGCPICCSEKRKAPRYSTKHFIEKAEKIHGKTYDYSESEYKRYDKKIKIICRKHGAFYQLPLQHIKKPDGSGCSECGKEKIAQAHKKTTEEFIEICKEIFGDLYTYEKSKYINCRTKVIITCRDHGDFKKTLIGIKQGQGCPECAEERKLTHGSVRWSYKYWVSAAEDSFNFDSYKIYIIKIIDIDGRVFYKIGRTYTTVDYRFRSVVKMPYDFEILGIVEGKALEICELEKKLQDMCSDFKYIPKKEFGGMHECFSSIDPIKEYIEILT